MKHMYQGRTAICGEPITAQSDVEWRGLLAIDCQKCRAVLLADKSAPQGWDPWNNEAHREAHQAMEESVTRDLNELKKLLDAVEDKTSFHSGMTVEPLPVRRPCCNVVGHEWNLHDICDHCGARASAELAKGRAARQPSLADRYVAFRATVERVVAEEAPAAKVVTDWAQASNGYPDRGLVFVELSGEHRGFSFRMDSPNAEEFLRGFIERWAKELGQRAFVRAR